MAGEKWAAKEKQALQEKQAQTAKEASAMDRRLVRDAVVKFVAGILIVGALIFVPAGSLAFPYGWLFMGLLFVPMFVAGLVMLLARPELLRRRLNAKEKEPEQRVVLAASALMFIAAFVVAGLSWRFGWFRFPDWLVKASSVLFLLGYLMFAEVLRENEYLSRTVEVQAGQQLIDSGLYGIVRHPMYSATVILFLAMPVLLNSPLSLVIMLAYLPICVIRIRNEERLLEQELEGYRDYAQRVRWRLVPFVW